MIINFNDNKCGAGHWSLIYRASTESGNSSLFKDIDYFCVFLEIC